MDSERLWAPWRLSYVTGDRSANDAADEPTAWLPGAKPECFICRAAAKYADATADRRLLVIARDAQTVAILNRYPYNNGHVLVCPARHVGELGSLTEAEHLAAMALLSRLIERMSQLLRAEGFNIGLNLGRTAGAGVPGHLHWHLVPRWTGDNNFLPVTAATRVIS
ncbi:MAG TPA: HIT domain-containing protein, partial [Lacipirellulaceae bacterium]|nr:HIT domain-containing protein [Lacipirellulaceae bacterium]